MAPEVHNARGKFGYSNKVDIFSFGVILWELAELKKPKRTREMVRNGQLEPLSPDRETETPKSLINLMQMCVRFQPQKRPAFFVIQNTLEKILKKKIETVYI